MGDSFISGEAGRWYGNVDLSDNETKDMYGTDRAAHGCILGERCKKDPNRTYGDSYRDPTKGSKNPTAGCHRSDVAEIRSASWKIAGREVEKLNVACSGAVAANIVNTYTRNELPQAWQLDDLKRKYDIKAIHVSIGGNDMQFSHIIEDCAAKFIAYPVVRKCKSKWRDRVEKGVAKGGVVRTAVEQALEKIISTMGRSGLNTRYRILLQSYPATLPRAEDMRYDEKDHSFDSTRWSPGGCPFFDTDITWARDEVVTRLSEMLEQVAKEKNVDFLDLHKAFEHHTLCRTGVGQAQSENHSGNRRPDTVSEWIRFVTKVLNVFKTRQGEVEESMHPNAYGQKALGTCLTKYYKQAKTASRRSYLCTDKANGKVSEMKLEEKSGARGTA